MTNRHSRLNDDSRHTVRPFKNKKQELCSEKIQVGQLNENFPYQNW